MRKALLCRNKVIVSKDSHAEQKRARLCEKQVLLSVSRNKVRH